jgi:hypothetical protein
VGDLPFSGQPKSEVEGPLFKSAEAGESGALE